MTSEPLRILQVAPCWFAVPPEGYGGIERVVHQLTEELVARGHEVVLAASGGSVTSARLVVHHARPPTTELGSVAPDLEHVLAALLTEHDVDVVHDHSGRLGAALVAVGSRPAVHTVHNGWRADTVGVYELVADQVDLVALSRSQKSLAPTGVRVAAVVHNAVEVPHRPLRAPTPGLLAFVGRASPDKGVLDAIEVARRLGAPLSLCVKVNQADEHAYWEQEVVPALVGVDAHVTLDASHEVVERVLAEAEVVLVPARWDEPFGLVAAEALACGAPVAGYRRGALPEVVAHGRTGVLVEEGDIDGLVVAAQRAARLDRGGCRRDMARRFSVAAMTDGYEAVYRGAVRRRGADTRQQLVVLP
jgi:glycosyltransferase involved in cell wall biosynthesis